jgi:hypothetical protein
MSVYTPDPTYRERSTAEPTPQPRVSRLTGAALWLVLGFAILLIAFAFFAARQAGFGGTVGTTTFDTGAGASRTNPSDLNRPATGVGDTTTGGPYGSTSSSSGPAGTDANSSVPGSQIGSQSGATTGGSVGGVPAASGPGSTAGGAAGGTASGIGTGR